MAILDQHCTAQAQVSDMPCLQCLSKKELLAGIVLVLALAEGYDLPDDLDELREDSACWTCLSDKQKLQGFLYQLGNKLLGGQYEEEGDLRDMMKCLLCFGDGDLKAMAAHLFCHVLGDFGRFR